MLDGDLALDEVSVVFGIEDCLVDVFSCEGNNRVEAVPEADRQELRAITIGSAD